MLKKELLNFLKQHLGHFPICKILTYNCLQSEIIFYFLFFFLLSTWPTKHQWGKHGNYGNYLDIQCQATIPLPIVFLLLCPGYNR